jgi:mRNA interferase MazF
MKQRNIVLLKWPFSDLSGTKLRPALVVSNDILNNRLADCIMVPLTTILKEEPYSITLYQKDLVSGKLIKPSRIRVDKIFAPAKSLIVKEIGTISEEIFNMVKKEIVACY